MGHSLSDTGGRQPESRIEQANPLLALNKQATTTVAVIPNIHRSPVFISIPLEPRPPKASDVRWNELWFETCPMVPEYQYG